MNGIGRSDVESYVRSLISEGFGGQFKDVTGSTEQPDESDQVAPSPVSGLPNNSLEDKRSDVGS